MPFVEDLSAFLSVAEFSSLALRLDTGADVPVIFDNGYALGNVGALGVANGQPTALARSADLAGLDVGGLLHIDSQNYAVAELQPDGTGMTLAVLERAA